MENSIYNGEEKRTTKQVPVYDENGNLEYMKIPNYRLHEPFLTKNEVNFFVTLINAVNQIKNLKLSIFAQVALNRIIDVNNERVKFGNSNKNDPEKSLWKEIHERSIDFVLYDRDKEKIYCCIELNDETHKQPKRKERDEIIEKILLEGDIRIIFQKRQNHYNVDEIVKKILDCEIEKYIKEEVKC